jgi:ribosomal protein L11 methyltransferase
MPWIEVSLTVEDGEQAEAVAEVLGRHIPDGIVIQTDRMDGDPDTEGRPIGPYKVCGYLPQDAQLEGKKQKITEGLWYLGRIKPLPPPIFQLLAETNWVDAWKKHYRPIPVGDHLLILPAWFENPNPERIPIAIDPGMAFGTGTHPTTQLALVLLEAAFRHYDRPAVIDVGCGSGVLSIAAAKLGAGQVLGLDTDGDAVQNAIRNVELNEGTGQIQLKTGSVADVLSGQLALRQAQIVVANILAPILIRLLEAGLAVLVAPGGRLVLSGILDAHEAEMQASFVKHGLVVVQRIQSGDWLAFSLSTSQV